MFDVCYSSLLLFPQSKKLQRERDEILDKNIELAGKLRTGETHSGA